MFDFFADAAEYFVDGPNGLLIFNDVAIFGGDHDRVKILKRDIQERIITKL